MDASFYAPGGSAVAETVPAVPRYPAPRPMPDLPAFQVVKPTQRFNLEDFKLPGGGSMIGPDGLLVPAGRSFSMIVNAATRVFSYRFDEAMRDNFVNARAMRRDAFLRGLLEERLLPTINRKWEIEIEDDRNPTQVLVRDQMSKIVRATPAFDAFNRALLDGVWFGRAGTQWNLRRNPDVDDYWCVGKWDPIHGDSIQFTFDGVPAVLLDSATAGWYSGHGAKWGPDGDLRSTDRGGTALVLQRPYWRNRFAIHVHMREKADYFEGELAGSVQGLGLRGLVYWHYVIRTEALTWMLSYMQAVGQMDLLIFNYPQGDAEAKQNAENNARKIIGKAAIACPRNPLGTWPAVEQVPMNEAGLKALHELISDYFDRHIERLVVGQSMSAGADDESGLGGTGRADFARATKDEILVYDTNRRDETMTTDFLTPLKKANFPWARFPMRFKSVLPDLDAKDKVANGETMIKNGVTIKTDEFREAAGYSRPEEGDETVGGPQTAGTGQPPGSTPNSPMHTAPGNPNPVGAPAQTYPRAALPPETPPNPPTPPQNPPRPPQPAQVPASRPQRPPVRLDAGGGMGGPAPAPSPSVGTTPNIGYPGGGNTYLPRFGRPRRPDERVGFTRFDRMDAPTPYVKYGCVLAPLFGAAGMAVLRAGAAVADADLAPDGREDEPHVTVRWGFPPAVGPAEIAGAVGRPGPVKMKLGKVDFFEADGYDVLFLAVESADLHVLHNQLAALPHTDTHGQYNPHATIAYVKKGLGKVYAGTIPAADLEWVVDELDFKKPDEPVSYSKDAAGHEHKPTGAGGGQFTGGGSGENPHSTYGERHTTILKAAKQLQSGKHTVEGVRAIRPHLESLARADVANIARELGYARLATESKPKIIDRLIENLTGLAMSRQRSHLIQNPHEPYTPDPAPVYQETDRG